MEIIFKESEERPLLRIEVPEKKSFLEYLFGGEGERQHIEQRRIFVDPEFRQQGIGTKLLNEEIRIAKEEGIKMIFVDSSTAEPQPFYYWLKANGFDHEPNNTSKWWLDIEAMEAELIPRRAMILDRLNKTKFDSILDVGCGRNGDLLWLVPEFIDAKKYACDIDEEDIKWVKKRFPTVEAKIASVLDLPYGENSIDVVLCDSVLYTFNRELQEEAIKNMERVARKMVIIVDPQISRVRELLKNETTRFYKIDNGASWEDGGMITWQT